MINGQILLDTIIVPPPPTISIGDANPLAPGQHLCDRQRHLEWHDASRRFHEFRIPGK
jgi:hypothetical protein